MKTKQDEVFNLKITDIMGNIKFQQNGISSMNAIDVSSYPSGLYYLNVNNSKGNYATKSWIKN